VPEAVIFSALPADKLRLMHSAEQLRIKSVYHQMSLRQAAELEKNLAAPLEEWTFHLLF